MFELQKWTEQHRQPFVEMQRDPAVMADLGGPVDAAASNAKFDRYSAGWNTDGISRWAVVDPSGIFLGYAGVMWRADPAHPLGPHHEIGWRFVRSAWGNGYASSSAALALEHAWAVLPVDEIFSYTAADNLRSQQVMARLNLRRAPDHDFTAHYTPQGDWSGLVWVAERPQSGAEQSS
jgi:RimJ/RimL family protein N-acetyltransferase